MNVMVDISSSDRKDSKRDTDASTELKKVETDREVGGGSFELAERSSDGRRKDLGKRPSVEAGVDVRFTLRTSLLVLTCTAAMILNVRPYSKLSRRCFAKVPRCIPVLDRDRLPQRLSSRLRSRPSVATTT